MTKKAILDVDTGSDDAVAIILAALSKDIDLIGITTVNGNRNVDITTINSLRVVSFLGLNIPVYKGCHLPMVSTLLKGRRDNVPYSGPEEKDQDVHGDYLPIPDTQMVQQKEHAVFLLGRNPFKYQRKDNTYCRRAVNISSNGSTDCAGHHKKH